MPLLKGRFVIPVKPLTDVKPDETIYTIPHTNEQFRSREEYKKRLALYKDTIWTCRCTGHINLTHEEARKSEQEKYTQLQNQFPEYFYKPVLMLVHHSTEILDNLVVEAWTRLHQKLVANEPVALKFKSQGSLIKGTVVKVVSDVMGEPLKPGPVNGCSPSSDKENKDATAGADHSDSPKKWTPIKLLPCKYNIRLQEGDTVISGVPSQDIVRLNRPPSKELIKLFIRAFAIRGGFQQNSPWSVQEDLVKKYSIPSKFADFLVSTSKMMEYGKKAMEEASKNLKKRKLSSQSELQAKKQKSDAKQDKSQERKPSAKKQLMLKLKVGSPAKSGSQAKDGTPRKTTPKKLNDGSVDQKMDTNSSMLDNLGSKLDSDESSSEDDISLATLKKSVDLTGDQSSSSSSEDENIALADLKQLNKMLDGKKRSKNALKNSSGKKSAKDAKKMKQMTLFDMKTKKKVPGTPKKTSSSTAKSPMASPKKSPYKQPPVVIRLLKANRDNNKPVYYQLLSMCVRELSGVQRNRLPLAVKDDVIKRWKRKQEKKKVALMTPEQKEAYIAQRREELRKKMKKKRAALNKRHEDTHLEMKPLPQPKLVSMPESLPNELFGDVVMVTAFISCYRGLLMPEDDQPVSTESLLKALAEGEKGFAYLSHVLVVMLQTLLQDGVAEGYMELSMPLADLPANLYTVSELVRLCLRHDDDTDSLSEEGLDDDEYMVPDAIIERLETCEMYALEPREKLQVLVGLCHRLMTSYSAQDFMTSRQHASLELWRQKNASLKEQKKKTSSSDGQKKVAGKTNENNKDSNSDGLTITHFYGAKEIESESPVIEEAASLAEVVKKRRLLAAKAVEEKAQREQEESERRRVEAEEVKRQREEELFEKNFTEGIAQAKSALRQCPIGTDRNHSRYWLFDGTTPGLYIEKGWVHENIEYRVHLVKNENSSDDDDSLLDFSSDSDSHFDGRRRKLQEMERTVPPVGQNLWFTYNSLEEVDALLKSLNPQGIRESSLQTELKKRYPSIVKTLNMPKKTDTSDPDLTPDGSTAMVAGFRQEMSDLEGRLRSGGLGGVPNYDDWLNKLNSVTTIKEFGECLIESERYVCNKFITGVLAKTIKKKPTAISAKLEDGEKEGDVKEEAEEKKDEEPEVMREEVVHVGMQSWTEAIEACPTLSRLHLLLSIFDSCIKWEKSAENAKCKICRKKRCEDKLLLCDECNQAFHLYCLRPALSYVPAGDWFCPSCSPTTHKNRSRVRNYRELAGEEEESGDTTETELLCMVCGGDDDVIICSTCSSAFHLDCHQPPLRRAPRSNWRCAQCTSGVRFRRQSRRTAAQRKVYTDDYEDSCTTEEESPPHQSYQQMRTKSGQFVKESEGDIAECNGRKCGRFSKGKYKKSTSSRKAPTPTVPESDDDDEEEEEDEEVEGEEEEEDTSVDTKILLMIVRKLERHRQAWPFLEKVDVDEVPDYYDIVKNPIDLESIREKVTGDQYAAYREFIDDVEQLFYNARLYNKTDSIVGQCIGPMQKYSQDLVVRHLPQCVETSGGEEQQAGDGHVFSTTSVLNGDDS